MVSENGEFFVKNLAAFVRTHEKALANALQLQDRRSRLPGASIHAGDSKPTTSAASALAAALSLGSLPFSSHHVKPAKLTLTPHHLFYLLSRFEELEIDVGPMNVRLESLQAEVSPGNYVSFLSQPSGSRGRSDRDSVHSVSSMRSVVSTMSSIWNWHLTSSSKSEKVQALLRADIKYLYSAFTKIPCLRLSPDHRARLISGYEEFPLDCAVPLNAFKNLSVLEISDLDFRQFYAWDKLSEQLRSLTIKRGHLEDPTDLLIGIVLDDIDKRRRRSSKQSPGTPIWPASPMPKLSSPSKAQTVPSSPSVESGFAKSTSPRDTSYLTDENAFVAPAPGPRARNKSSSPARPSHGRQPSYRQSKTRRRKRSRSGSSGSSHESNAHSRSRSSSNFLSLGILPASKWRFLRHLALPDNGLTQLRSTSLAPLSNGLISLDLSSNLFAEIPDSLASLPSLRGLNLSGCMIDSLHSVTRSPLPAVNSLNLRQNRLLSIAGVERLLSLERLDLRDNKITDPMEMARLTGVPDLREIFVAGNPLCKLHPNYRITIFNLFRSVPGRQEDIVIDGTNPTYGERRQLKEKTADPAVTDAVSGAHSLRMPALPTLGVAGHHHQHQQPASHAIPFLQDQSRTHSGEVHVGTEKRRRIQKRRIIDLVPGPNLWPLDNQNNISGHTAATRIAIPVTESSTTLSAEQRSPVTPEAQLSMPKTASEATIVASDDELMLEDDMQHLSVGDNTYRRKIEGLKAKFPEVWLGMLGHDHRGSQDIPQGQDDLEGIQPPVRVVIGSGRSLG